MIAAKRSGYVTALLPAGVLKKGLQESPCLEYEKHRAEEKNVAP